jgi:hypothetical protein
MIANCRLPIADLRFSEESLSFVRQEERVLVSTIGNWQSAIGNQLGRR